MSGGERGCGESIALAVAIVAVVGTGLFAQAWTVQLLWGWFVAPLGLPAVTFWHAMGLGLAVSIFRTYTDKEAAAEAAERPWLGLGKTVGKWGARYAVAVLLGWGVHAIMVAS